MFQGRIEASVTDRKGSEEDSVISELLPGREKEAHARNAARSMSLVVQSSQRIRRFKRPRRRKPSRRKEVGPRCSTAVISAAGTRSSRSTGGTRTPTK